MERVTRAREAANESQDPDAGKEVTQFESDGKNVPCSSLNNPRCLSRKQNRCCGEKHEPKRNDWESISAFGKGGRNERKDCAPTCAPEVKTGKRDGKYVSGAADLACVLLFGMTMSELIESEDSPGSRQ